MGRASEKRRARVASLVQRVLASTIQYELSDPRLEMATLSDVEMSPDLTYARIKVRVMGDIEAEKDCLAALESASQLLWNRLRSETDLRKIPKLAFEIDPGPRYEREITELLEQIPPYADEDDEAEEEAADES